MLDRYIIYEMLYEIDNIGEDAIKYCNATCSTIRLNARGSSNVKILLVTD